MIRRALKRGRVRPDPKSYAQLRAKVLARDGWKCQACGTASDLDVHHLIPRSKLGEDAPENLITLCRACHTLAHRERFAFLSRFHLLKRHS